MMGLTAQMPIFNPEREQVGILFIITILNNNYAAIQAINAITGVEFTAITPAGEIIASFFVNPSVLTPEIIKKTRQAAIEMAQGIREPKGKDTVVYTKERVYLKICPGMVIFKNGTGTCYLDGEVIPSEDLEEKAYRFHFIAEVDPDFHHVAIRGIAYDLTYFDELMAAQKRYFLITLLIAFLLIGGISLVVANKGAHPISEFTTKTSTNSKRGFKTEN